MVSVSWQCVPSFACAQLLASHGPAAYVLGYLQGFGLFEFRFMATFFVQLQDPSSPSVLPGHAPRPEAHLLP